MNEQVTLTKEEIQELLDMAEGKQVQARSTVLPIKLQALLAEMNSIGLINLANNYNDNDSIFYKKD